MTEPEELLVSIINTPICLPGDLSTATLVANGGTQPYIFTWSTGEITSSIYNLTPGNYSVDLDGTGDYLSWPSTTDISFGVGNA